MKPKIVVIHGAKGSFAERAADQLYPQATLKYCASAAEVEKVLNGNRADIAVLPIHNSIYGKVSDKDLMIAENNWQVVEKIELKIVQSLIGAKNSTLEKINFVESHAAAIAQCSQFLERFPQWQIVVSENTAESAVRAANDQSGTRAAIADARNAEIYQGKVLAAGIQDASENFTTFAAVQKEKRSTSDRERLKSNTAGT